MHNRLANDIKICNCLHKLALVLIVLLIINCIACGRRNELQKYSGGSDKMKTNGLSQELRDLETDDRNKLNSLVAKVEKGARETVREAVQIWIRSDPAMSKKAALLLSGLDDLAIVPLIEIDDPQSSLQRVWRMRRVVQAELALRNDLAAMLERMLDDKTIVSFPRLKGPIEKEPPPMRVCDEAYIQMRSLVRFGESPGKYGLNVSMFLNLNFDERDREIILYRNSKTWTQFLE